MEFTHIYLIENCYEDSNKVYIGKTKNCRYNNHKKKFGDKIKYTILEEIPSLSYNLWEPLESYWIEQFRQWGFEVMNKRKKGGSGPEYQTEETKQKIKQKTTGHKKSHDTKTKMSLSHKGKLLSKETKEKISLSNKGKIFSHSHIENLKKGHSLKDRNFYRSMEWLNNIKKPILQYDLEGNFIRTWDSIKEASESLGVNRIGISHCLLGNQKTAYNYIWKYQL